MRFSRISITATCALILMCAAAQSREVFQARFPALSPDGSQVAFEYWGDLWVAATNGAGQARRLTDHLAFDTTPGFSPDGSELAFVSNRSGNNDIWVIPVQGGVARQVTNHSGEESLQGWSPDGLRILFTSNRHLWGSDLWHVDAQGKTPPVQVTMLDHQSIQAAVMLPDESFIVSRGGGRWWRKGYRGAAQMDLWQMTPGEPSVQLTTHRGYDQWPLASLDDKYVYYTTDADGIANLWRLTVKSKARKQLTFHQSDGVQFPGISADGKTLVYEYAGELYTIKSAGGQPSQLRLEISAEPKNNLVTKRNWRNDASEYAVSPHGKYVVVVVEGDLWAVRDPAEYKDDEKPDQNLAEALRLTASDDARERNPLFINNTTVVYASDEDGDYELYQLDLQTLQIEQLTDNSIDDMEPSIDPSDENVLFWFSGNLELRRMELDTGNSTLIVEHGFRHGFSYGEYQVSPDGRWVAYNASLPNWTSDLFIAPVDGSSEPVNITRHPDREGDVRWSPDGKSLLYTANRNDRNGVYVVDLVPQGETYDMTFLFDEDIEEPEDDGNPEDDVEKDNIDDKVKGDEQAVEDAGHDNPDEDPDDEESDTENGEAEPTEVNDQDKDEDEDDKLVVEIDFEDINLRARRVSTQDNATDGIFSDDGKWLAYNAYPDGGGRQVWAVKTEGGSARKLFDGSLRSRMLAGKNRIYRLDGGTVKYFKFIGGSNKGSGTIDAEGEFWLDQRARWRQMYREGWHILGQRFYDPKMHGADWNAVYRKYLPYLEHIGTPEEFSMMFEEMMGELNGSHLGISIKGSYSTDSHITCSLGLEFDPAHTGPGLKISHVTYQGPADQPGVELTEGDLLLSIEGTTVDASWRWWEVLDDCQGQPTRLVLAAEESDNGEREVVLKPITYSGYQGLLYREWELANEQLVAELSGNRIGYIHISSMNGSELRKFEREFFSEVFEKDALIVDVRFNPGGMIHEQLFELLDRNLFGFSQSGRDTPWIQQPARAFAKPKALLINSRSGSDAEIFPAGWRALGLGPVIGEETAGAVIGTTGFTLIDGTYVRLPVNGWYELDGRDLEKSGTPPDIAVTVHPDELREGYDAQLERAVEVLLKALGQS